MSDRTDNLVQVVDDTLTHLTRGQLNPGKAGACVNNEMTHVDLDDLVDAEKNPNVMDADRFALLVGAIRKIGFLEPIVVREVDPEAHGGKGHQIVNGHHRVRAAREAGIVGTIPCVVTDATDDEARALGVGMNRLRGELDLAAVADVMAELRAANWSVDDMALTGFTPDELADLLAAGQPGVESIMAGGFEQPDPPAQDHPHVLELAFATIDELRAAKRALKRAGGGDLAAGLLKLIG